MNTALISVGDRVHFEQAHENPDGSQLMLVCTGRVEALNRNFTPSLAEVIVSDSHGNEHDYYVTVCNLRKVH